MNVIQIATIVEGHGDVEAVSILIRRIASDICPSIAIDVKQPIRKPAEQLKK